MMSFFDAPKRPIEEVKMSLLQKGFTLRETGGTGYLNFVNTKMNVRISLNVKNYRFFAYDHRANKLIGTESTEDLRAMSWFDEVDGALYRELVEVSP